jgi:non-specific protein-tyrosine kinase
MSLRPETTEPYTESWLNQPWRAVRSQLGVVITIIALTTFAAAIVTLRQPTKYAATTTFVVRTLRTGETDTESTVRTLAALLKSNAVGADVAREARLTLTPKQVAKEISVSRPPGSGVLETRVTDVSRRRALRIAEVIVPVFADRVDSSLKPDAADPTADTGVFVKSWDADVTSVVSVPPPVARNIALGLMLGVVLTILAVALREQRAPYVRSAAQAHRIFDLPVVAALPPLSRRGRAPWNVVDTIQGLLASTPDVGWPSRPQAILVTGPESSGARSALTLAIGTAIAVTGAHVVLVDADLEHAVLTSLLDMKKTPGFREFLLRQLPAREAVVSVPPADLPGWLGVTGAVKGSLFLLPNGVEKCDEGEIGSIRVSALLSSLKSGSVVVIDGPRVPGPAPVTRLLEASDAVLAVAVDGTTRAPAAQATGGVLRALGGPPAAGILLETNRFEVLATRMPGSPLPGTRLRDVAADEPQIVSDPFGGDVTALPWG